LRRDRANSLYCWHLANGLSGFALSTTTR
jgi:hypothetical protein